MTKPHSIRGRLISLYVFVLALAFAGFSLYAWVGLRSFLVDSLKQSLARRVHRVVDSLLIELPDKGIQYVGSEIKARYAPELNERIIRISDLNGRVIYSSAYPDVLPRPSLEVIPPGAVASDIQFESVELPDGLQLMMASQTCQIGRDNTYRVDVAAPDHDVRSALRGLLITLGLAFPVLLGLAIAGGYVLLGRALRPVDGMIRATEIITSGNLANRLPVEPTNDEFERLARELNRMIARLHEAYQHATRFSADASHELRTPLTVMRGELEMLLQEGKLSDDLAARLDSVLGETERLGRIVEGLLLVSRLEAGEAQMSKSVADLGELVRETTDHLSLLAEEKGLTLTQDLEQGVQVNVDQARLRQVVVNLIDNAVKYTPHGGRVSLKVAAENGRARLEVADTGMGISASALPHVFERFYRADEARAFRNRGTGLGLSIVQSIVVAHGGSISVESRGQEGTIFRIDLPSVPSETT